TFVSRSTPSDRMGVRFAKAITSNQPTTMTMEGCEADSGAAFPLTLEEIYDDNIDPDAAELVFGIVRLSYEALQFAWAQPQWPTQRLPVILSQREPLTRKDLLERDH